MTWFPNGFGTRAILAFGVVASVIGLAVTLVLKFPEGELTSKLVLGLLTLANMAFVAYFLDKAHNGGEQ
jgi:hypothetical protein